MALAMSSAVTLRRASCVTADRFGLCGTCGSCKKDCNGSSGQERRNWLNAPDNRRTEILERLADHVLEHGLSASSLRALAAAAGTSDRMLLYYFRDKPEIIAATITTIAGRLMAILGGDAASAPKPFGALKQELARSLFSDQFWPYMRLWLEIAALSAKGDPFFRHVGGEIGRGFLAWGAARLDCADEAQRRREAARLLLAVEGMLLLKSIGLDDVAEEAL